MKTIYRVFMLVGAILISQFSIAQANNSVYSAAPNLPKMERYDNVGEAFNGINHQYKSIENETKIKDWIANFPKEVLAYEEAVNDYLKSDYASMSENEKEIYDDLVSQWIMFSQF